MIRILLATLVLFAAATARAQPAEKPILLVASPAMDGPYRHTVLIAFPSGEEHIGFIVNRATDAKLASLFPEHEPSAKAAAPVRFGGPVFPDMLFGLARRDPGAGAVALPGGVYLAASEAAVDRLIEQAPDEARFFAGFVGWQPRELQKELDAGYWYATEADPAVLFRDDTESLWEELVQRIGNGHAPQRGLSST